VAAGYGADMHQIWPGGGVAAGYGADMHQIWPGGGVAAGYGADLHQIWPGEGWRPDMVQICTRFGLEKGGGRIWCRFAPDLAWRRQ